MIGNRLKDINLNSNEFLWGCKVKFILVLGMLFASLPANAGVIYDTISGVENTGGSGWNEILEQGGQVNLGGTERVVTSFEIGLSSGPIVGTTAEFRIKFYSVDTASGSPDDILWVSEVVSSFVPRATIEEFLVVSFDVPDIEVPDSFFWTIEAFSEKRFTVLNGAAASIGCEEEEIILRLSNQWEVISPQEGYSRSGRVRIHADEGELAGQSIECSPIPPKGTTSTSVPEPGGIAFLAFGLVGLGGYRKFRLQSLP